MPLLDVSLFFLFCYVAAAAAAGLRGMRMFSFFLFFYFCVEGYDAVSEPMVIGARDDVEIYRREGDLAARESRSRDLIARCGMTGNGARSPCARSRICRRVVVIFVCTISREFDSFETVRV